MKIRQAKSVDAVEIADIYNWYILNSIITFETDVVSTEEMTIRINEKLQNYDWLVGEVDDKVIGYAYYGAFRARAAYSHTVESTIYLTQEAKGRGFGRLLYTQLIESAMEHGFREMIGVIALPNCESVSLHEKIGFSKVGILKNVGYKFGDYIDTGMWQKSLL